jgi:integration host factor subunit beta
MNKTELAERLAKKCDIPRSKAREIVDTLFDTRPGRGIIAVELDAGRKVQVRGFGTFGTKRRASRPGRNPATGSAITIAPKKYPFFEAGSGLEDRVGGPSGDVSDSLRYFVTSYGKFGR